MNRREFMRKAAAAMLATGGGMGLPLLSSRALATPGLPLPRTLVHIMLRGGADFRYIFAPAPEADPDYVGKYWQARKRLFSGGYTDYATLFDNEYTRVTIPGTATDFGIHNSCGWLAQQFTSQNVAVIANVFGSNNRKHDQSQLAVYSGDIDVGQFDTNRDGWGGRLVEAISSEARVAALSETVSMFCNGSDEIDRQAAVFHGLNMRSSGLPVIDNAQAVSSPGNVLTRGLGAYYRARDAEIAASAPQDWPYRRLFNHHRSLRTFGASIDQRLGSVSVPPALQSLALDSSQFTQQCRNLYDSYFVTDILNTRVLSLEYLGWDHHIRLQNYIEPKLADVFGAAGGLASVTGSLASEYPEALPQSLIVFSSDFGRQLAANGSLGVDHGHGSYTVLVGEGVAGGVYGEMFPLVEAMPHPDDAAGRSPYEIPGTDIAGRTAYTRVMASVCDWIQPGTGSVVFPGVDASALEPGVTLDLFT